MFSKKGLRIDVENKRGLDLFLSTLSRLAFPVVCVDYPSSLYICPLLQVLDDCIFAFFAVEMVIKMVALGIFGSNCYLGDKWNQLDFVIVMAG